MSARKNVLYVCLALLGAPPTAKAQLTIVTARDAEDNVTAVELISLRTKADIQADLDRATLALARAEADVQECRYELQRCQADVDIQRSRIDITKTELKLARSQRREADRQNLEQRKRVQDAERELLERVEDAVKARLKYSEEVLEWAQAAVMAHQLELELVERNAELASFAGRGSGGQAPDWLGEGLDDLRGRVLTAMRTAAEREVRVARERRSYVGAQLEVLEAQRKLTDRLGDPT